jgi:lysozyme
MSDFTSKLVDELIRDEGLRLKPYVDSVGKLTIGVGRNLTDVGISEAEAHVLLAADIMSAERVLDRFTPWWRGLTEDRQRVMINMAFNLGLNLLEFRRTLAFIESGQYEKAADAMLESKWAQQVGPRAVRLAERMKGKEIA